MRLAERMGCLDVDAMLAAMDSVQLSEWIAFDRVNHSEAMRAGAMVACTVANSFGGGNFTEADFLPRRPEPVEDAEAEDIKAAFRAYRERGAGG